MARIGGGVCTAWESCIRWTSTGRGRGCCLPSMDLLCVSLNLVQYVILFIECMITHVSNLILLDRGKGPHILSMRAVAQLSPVPACSFFLLLSPPRLATCSPSGVSRSCTCKMAYYMFINRKIFQSSLFTENTNEYPRLLISVIQLLMHD